MVKKNSTVKKAPKKGGDTGNGFDKRPEDMNGDGRPETPWQWKELFLVELEKKAEKDERMKKKQAIAIKMVDKAVEGDVQAFDRIADRMEGRPVQAHGILDEDGKYQSISVTFV